MGTCQVCKKVRMELTVIRECDSCALIAAAAPEMVDIIKRAQVVEFMAHGYTDFYREIGALIDRVQGVT